MPNTSEARMKIVPMTEAEYETWREAHREHLIEDKLRDQELSRQVAEQSTDAAFAQVLPRGIHSPDQFLFTLRDDQSNVVGQLWFAERGVESHRTAYLYDIVIDERCRGRGYGRRAMELLEEEVARRNLHAIGLHVHAHNKVAKRLYDSQGYRETGTVMEKVIRP